MFTLFIKCYEMSKVTFQFIVSIQCMLYILSRQASSNLEHRNIGIFQSRQVSDLYVVIIIIIIIIMIIIYYYYYYYKNIFFIIIIIIIFFLMWGFCCFVLLYTHFIILFSAFYTKMF